MAGCFNDTCSTIVTQTTGGSGGAYEIDVQTYDEHGITCIDGQGIGAKLANPNVTGVGNDILRFDASGNMHASLPAITIQPFTATDKVPVLPAVELANSVKTGTNTFSNTYGVPVTIIAQGTWNLTFAVLSPANGTTDPNIIRTGWLTTDGTGPGDATNVVPFNAMFGVRVLADNNTAVPTTAARSNRFATSGNQVTFAGSGFQIMTERRSFTLARTLPAGASLGLRADIFHEGNNQTMNLLTHGTAGGTELGFSLDEGSFVVFPLAS